MRKLQLKIQSLQKKVGEGSVSVTEGFVSHRLLVSYAVAYVSTHYSKCIFVTKAMHPGTYLVYGTHIVPEHIMCQILMKYQDFSFYYNIISSSRATFR